LIEHNVEPALLCIEVSNYAVADLAVEHADTQAITHLCSDYLIDMYQSVVRERDSVVADQISGT
jgi:hypothetical protein